jgi:hypothetical protein
MICLSSSQVLLRDITALGAVPVLQTREEAWTWIDPGFQGLTVLVVPGLLGHLQRCL